MFGSFALKEIQRNQRNSAYIAKSNSWYIQLLQLSQEMVSRSWVKVHIKFAGPFQSKTIFVKKLTVT